MGAQLSYAAKLKTYFCVAGIPAAASVALYVLLPDGTAKHFGGVPSLTTRTWIPIVAAGDAVCAFLCYKGFKARHPAVQELAVQATSFYGTLHMAAFLWAHLTVQPQPQGRMHYVSVALGLAAGLYFGVFKRPTVVSGKGA